MKSTVRGVELDYQLDGEPTGSQLRFVWGHGLTSSRADEGVDPVLLDWSRVNAATPSLRYDARGHGLSGFTSEPSAYGWYEMALDQLELIDTVGIDTVGIDRFVLGGASMGAGTALHTALLAPDRVESLVLVIPPTGWETRAEQTGMYIKMAEIVEAGKIEALIQAGAATPAPGPFAEDEQDAERHAERRAARMRAADPVRLAGTFRGAATANLPSKADVATIDVPTLILAWSGDPAHPVSSAELLGELMPQATVSVAATMAEYNTWTDQVLAFLNR
ncbi:MAG: alpha/beta fold hydrolase [Acidimicrobiales bacterium]